MLTKGTRKRSTHRGVAVMAASGLSSGILVSAHVDDQSGDTEPLAVYEMMTVMLCQRRPATTWEVVAQLGDSGVARVSAVLKGLTGTGTLVKFRVGLTQYYASPAVALTGHAPPPRTVLSDLFKNLFISWRSRVTKHQASSRAGGF